MTFGMSVEMMAKAKEVGEHYTMKVVRDRVDGEISIKLIPKDDQGKQQLATLVENLSNSMCSHFYTFFGVEGEIVDVES